MSEAMLTWIDTHVHWDAAEFDQDREAALVRAKLAGVTHCLNPSVSVSGVSQIQALAKASHSRNDWPTLLPAYGIHPLYIDQIQPDDLQRLEAQLRAHRPFAIGEIGLDAYTGAPDFAKQQRVFEAQLHLAATYQLPVLLHVRHAVEAVIQTLKRVQRSGQKIPGGIAHAFNGSAVQAQQLIDMGFLLGFGGGCTYEGSTRIRALAAQLPLTAIVLETDAPDMSPVWLHGQRNESNQLPLVAKTVAALRQISLTALSEATTGNVARLLGRLTNGASAR